jgi:hypothetical protein
MRRHRYPARVTGTRTDERNEAGEDSAKQGQKDDCLIHALVSLS